MKHIYGTLPEHPTDTGALQFVTNDKKTTMNYAPLT